MGFLSFLKEKKFYINLAIIILVSVVLFKLTFRVLKSYTRHDEVYVLPDFRGNYHKETVAEYGDLFNFILSDSIYVKDAPKGSIIQQDPNPGSKVKQGRNIYYVIVAETPEKSVMPNLVNLSLRQAFVSLEIAGLDVDRLHFVDHFARNAVVGQRFEGETIEEGTELNKSSKIELIVGNGMDGKKTQMPNLFGSRPDEVKKNLHNASLNLGNETYMDDDTANSRVYRTNPSLKTEMVILGQNVDVWYRSEKEFDFSKYLNEQALLDSLQSILDIEASPDSLKQTESEYEY